MRFLRPSLLLIGSLILSGCAGSAQSSRPSETWTTGFWLWPGSTIDSSATNGELDVLYFGVGYIRKPAKRYAKDPWFVMYGRLPDESPPAREYWVVYRFEEPNVPEIQAAPFISRRVSQLREEARKRRLNVVGLQLDIDSPTGKLSDYARFLREVRRGLPAGASLSITALLDWFRDGTSIADVIREVDEFVPQFYDVADPDDYSGGTGIAKRIDAAQWAPKFNRFGKRFRVGISTFGRGRMIPGEIRSARYHSNAVIGYRDLTPIDIALNSAFSLKTSRNEGEELVLRYRADRATRIEYSDILPGDTFEFILSTPEAVQAAVRGAKDMGGNCAGVLFFRWPGRDETMVMEPREVLLSAGLGTGLQQKIAGIHAADGGCAAVHCVDLYLVNANPFAPKPTRYRVRSSTELEYFLPEKGMPVRMAGPSELEFTMPPYCGRGRLYLGRAVAAKRAEYTIGEVR